MSLCLCGECLPSSAAAIAKPQSPPKPAASQSLCLPHASSSTRTTTPGCSTTKASRPSRPNAREPNRKMPRRTGSNSAAVHPLRKVHDTFPRLSPPHPLDHPLESALRIDARTIPISRQLRSGVVSENVRRSEISRNSVINDSSEALAWNKRLSISFVVSY